MSNHRIKINRAIANSGIFKGAETIKAVMAKVPQCAIEKLSSRELTEIINAIDISYHNGRNDEYKELKDHDLLDASLLN